MNSFAVPSLNELCAEFEALEDWDERYEFLVDLGRQLPPLETRLQNDANRVRGCMSTVWLDLQIGDDPDRRIHIAADSDSLIVKGLIVLLLAIYENQPAAEVSHIDAAGILKGLGLAQHLSPNRRNGLFAMVGRVQELAAEAA